jgi:3-oxoacid CoA-transferase subunit A
MEYVYDEEIRGMVYYEPAYPKIIYLIDGEVYDFNGHKTLVLGGAYSVDKDYRKARGWAWWANEQLSPEEQCAILNRVNGKYYDFVLSHTCPYSWEPREMFLSCIDQSTVDKSTETWLEEIEQNIDYNFWLFGHFHGDKIVNSKAAMLYEQIVDLNMIQPIDKYTEIPEGFII